MNGKTAQNIILIIFLIALCGFGYIGYRYVKADEFISADFAHKDISGFPAIVCTYGSSAFAGASSGRLYVYKGEMRDDLVTAASSRTIVSHSIVDTSKTDSQWIDGAQNGYTGSITAVEAETGVPEPDQLAALSPRNGFTCSPWWSPQASLFVLPDTVTFSSP